MKIVEEENFSKEYVKDKDRLKIPAKWTVKGSFISNAYLFCFLLNNLS